MSRRELREYGVDHLGVVLVRGVCTMVQEQECGCVRGVRQVRSSSERT